MEIAKKMYFADVTCIKFKYSVYISGASKSARAETPVGLPLQVHVYVHVLFRNLSINSRLGVRSLPS